MDFIEKPLDRDIFLSKVKSALKKDDFSNSCDGHKLTKAERKVLKLVLDGKGNKEIAYKLQRAIRTVERHRSNIMHKFNADNIVDLVKKTALMNLRDIE